MDANQFAYWLQGFAELHGTPPTKEQWKSIREHLQLVFQKVTPPVHAPLRRLGVGGVADIARPFPIGAVQC